MTELNYARSFRDLAVYKKSRKVSRAIFEMSKTFPKEEIYSLTDQMRRASRSIGAQIAEAWAKRRYAAHFLSKLTDSDGELQETLHWLFTAHECGYLSKLQLDELQAKLAGTGRQLGSMINRHESFCY